MYFVFLNIFINIANAHICCSYTSSKILGVWFVNLYFSTALIVQNVYYFKMYFVKKNIAMGECFTLNFCDL